jgi:hypothetical protein
MDPEDLVPDDSVGSFEDGNEPQFDLEDLAAILEEPSAPEAKRQAVPPPATLAPTSAPKVVPQAKRRRTVSSARGVYLEPNNPSRPAAPASQAAGPRRRGAMRTPVQAEVVEAASRQVKVEEFESATPVTPREMLAHAQTLKRGDDVPYASLFGPPPAVDTAAVGHVPRVATFLEMHIANVLRVIEPRRKATDPVPPASLEREAPRLITGHDMQRHYLWEAVPRPSPVTPGILLRPEPCVMGNRCAAVKFYEPMLEGFTRPFALVGMLSEADMRRFYQTGQWPKGAREACIVCHIMLTQSCAVVINNLCPSSRNPVIQYQSVRNDADPRTGFKPFALAEPGTESSVVEYPMMRLSAPSARVRHWSAGVQHIDISPALNNPVPCDNSNVWSVDELAAALPPVKPSRSKN